jgi:hypothetical protein
VPSLTPKQLAAYAGRYVSPELDVTWTLAVKDTNLVGTGVRGVEVTIRPAAADTFRVSSAPTGPGGTVAFARNKKGKIDALLLTLSRSRNIRFDRKD